MKILLKAIITAIAALLIAAPIALAAPYQYWQGGTGTSTAAIPGQILESILGGNYQAFSTSTLGLPLFSDLANYIQSSAFNTLFDVRLTATTSLPKITTLSGLTLPFSQTSGTVPINRGGTNLTSVGASSTALVTNGTAAFWQKLATSQLTNDSGFLTSLAGAASSTLLGDNNTFTGANNILYASTSQITIGAGSVTLPGLTIAGSPTTGLYANGTNILGLAANGAGVSWDGTAFYPNTTSIRNLGKTGQVWNDLFANYASTTAVSVSGPLYTNVSSGNVLVTGANGLVQGNGLVTIGNGGTFNNTYALNTPLEYNGTKITSTSSVGIFDNLIGTTTASSTFVGGIDAARVCIQGTTTCLSPGGTGSSASSTLLTDNNTFSGVTKFTNSSFALSFPLSISSGGLGLNTIGASSTVLMSNGTSNSYKTLSPGNFTTANISQWTNDSGYLTIGTLPFTYPFPLVVGGTNGTSSVQRYDGGMISNASSSFSAGLTIANNVPLEFAGGSGNPTDLKTTNTGDFLFQTGTNQNWLARCGIDQATKRLAFTNNGVNTDLFSITCGTGNAIFTGTITAASTTATSTFANGIEFTGGGIKLDKFPNCNGTLNLETDSSGNISCGADASSTLLADNNAFSGINQFTNAATTTFTGRISTPSASTTATSTFAGINLPYGGCYAILGSCIVGGTGGSGTVTSVTGNNGLTGTVTVSGNIGLDLTKEVAGSLQIWNGSQFQATGTPSLTVGYLIATSTATSTFTGGVNLNGTDCFAVQGTCLQTFIQNATAYKSAANYATTAALPTNTYNNGTGGVGATLTEVGTGALSVDGQSPSLGQRILVKNEATAANNGVYTVTATGSGIAAYVLTRATDFNASVDVYAGVTVPVLSGGTTNGDSSWVQTTTGTITIGTTAISFIESSVGTATVTSLASANSSLTISPSTGAVDASINLTHANSFSGLQTFVSASSTALSVLNQLTVASTTVPSNLIFSVGSTTPLALTVNNQTGYLGFGTTSPEAPFTMAVTNSLLRPDFIIDGQGTGNGAEMELNRSSNTNTEANIDFNTNGVNYWQCGLQDNLTNDFECWDGNDRPAFTIKNGTNSIGFGSTTPFGDFVIDAEYGDVLPGNLIFNVASSTLTATTSLFVINNVGNVGIGSSTPTQALSVVGNMELSGNITELGNATSTYTNGISISSGCFAIVTTCIGGSGTVNSGLTGELSWYAGNGTSLSASSSDSLTIGRLFATSTATSTLGGPVIVGTPAAKVKASCITMFYHTGANSFATSSLFFNTAGVFTSVAGPCTDTDGGLSTTTLKLGGGIND